MFPRNDANPSARIRCMPLSFLQSSPRCVELRIGCAPRGNILASILGICRIQHTGSQFRVLDLLAWQPPNRDPDCGSDPCLPDDDGGGDRHNRNCDPSNSRKPCRDLVLDIRKPFVDARGQYVDPFCMDDDGLVPGLAAMIHQEPRLGPDVVRPVGDVLRCRACRQEQDEASCRECSQVSSRSCRGAWWSIPAE